MQFERHGWACDLIGDVSDPGSIADVLTDGREPTGGAAGVPSGDYCLVVAREGEIRLFRSHGGRLPLYYSKHSDGCIDAASTSVRSIAGQSRISRRFIAYFLAMGGRQVLHNTTTPFESVARVQPGHLLTFIDRRLVSDRQINLSHTHATSIPSVSDAVGQALTMAIRRQLRPVTGIHLSGGLDSTAVALLAAVENVNDAYSRQLVTVSAVYSNGQLAREQPFLKAAREAISAIDATVKHLTVDGDDLLDFDSFNRTASSFDEPNPDAFRAPWLLALNEAALDNGCEAVLTGCGSDPLMDTTVHHLASSVPEVFSRYRDFEQWALARDRSTVGCLFENLIQRRLPLVWDSRRRLRLHGSDLMRLGDFDRPPWLRRDCEVASMYNSIADEQSHSLYRGGVDSLFRAATEICAPDHISWLALRSPHQPRLFHPFLDSHVVEIVVERHEECLDIGFERKALLRKVMGDLMPSEIVRRTKKVAFNQVYQDGLRRNFESIEQLLHSASDEVVCVDVFDLDTLRDCTRQAMYGFGTSDVTDRLNAALSLISWLLDTKQSQRSQASKSGDYDSPQILWTSDSEC